MDNKEFFFYPVEECKPEFYSLPVFNLVSITFEIKNPFALFHNRFPLTILKLSLPVMEPVNFHFSISFRWS